MFPSDFFFGEQSVLKWTNQSLPHDIPPFTPHEFLQCIGVLYGLCLAGQSSAKDLWQAKILVFVSRFVYRNDLVCLGIVSCSGRSI